MSADEFDFEDYLFGHMKSAQRRVRALEAQLEAAGFDPDEAPLWRRISEQRKQLRDANTRIGNLGEALEIALAHNSLSSGARFDLIEREMDERNERLGREANLTPERLYGEDKTNGQVTG